MSVKRKRVKQTVQGNHVPPDGDRVDEEGLEQGDHPLQNDLILETLFGFVRRFDLKACRVVSKKWNLHTIPFMRSHFVVTIRGSQFNATTDQVTRRIDQFVELFNSNQYGIPFTKFQLGQFCTTEGVGEQFLKLCGETATEIDLDGEFGEESEAYTVEDLAELLRGCPNIKVLALPYRLISRSRKIVKLFPDSVPNCSSLKKITFRPDFKNDKLKFCPTSTEELLTAGSNICDLSVSDPYKDEEDEDNGRNINVVLNCIEKLGKESSIQTLFLHFAKIQNIEHLQKMAENGLKLKSLTLIPNNLDEYDRDIVQIQLATCFKDTLEYFIVREHVDNILMEFPNMAKLKSLSLRVCNDFDPKPVNLNMNFPLLQTLDLSVDGRNEDEEGWSSFFSEFESCPTLKSLIVDDEEMRIHTFHDVVRIFPNLTKLNLRIGPHDGVEILRHIWSQMTGLESLSIWGSIEGMEKEYLDSLFTGIPIQALKNITPIVNTFDKMTVQQRGEIIQELQNDHSRLPSLRNLRKLRHLNVNVSGGEDCENWAKRREIHLTDLTAYLAFYSMRQLNHLSLHQCDFTKTCCEILTKETGLEFWSFQNQEYKYIIPKFVPRE